MKPNRFTPPLIAISAITLSLAPPSLVHASTISWDGDTSTAWADGNNWTGNVAPANDLVTDIAQFNLASYTNQPNAGTTSVNGIQIGDGATATGALTLSGTSLTLGSSGISMLANAGAATISSPVILGAAQNWTNNSGSLLTVSGTVNNGGFLLTSGGSGNTAISGAISGSGGLTKTGSGILTLSATNTFSGGLIISGGSVSIAANTALGGASGTAGAVTIDGGTLRTTNTAILTNTHAITIGAGGGTFDIVGTAVAGQASRIIFNTAGTLIGSGALTVAGDGALDSAGGSGVLVLNQANAGYTGNVTMRDGGMVEIGNANAVGVGATFTLGNNGGLNVNSGLTLARDLTVNGTGSVLSFSNGNAGIFSGAITLNNNLTIGLRDWYNLGTVRGGTITNTITGAHTIAMNSGTTLGTGGTLTLGGFDAKASSADLVLNGASLAINSGSGTAAASVTRGNSLTINTGNLTVTGVASQNTNDVFGTLNLGGGSGLNANGTGNLQGYSTWTITPNAATNAALTFTNMGTRTTGSWVALAGTFGGAPGANMGNIHFTNALSGSNLIGAGGSLASGTASVIPWLRDTGGNAIFGYDATNGIAAVTTLNVNPDLATAGQNINWNAASTLTANRTINSLQAAFSGINLGGNTLTVSSGVITADNASFSNGTLDFGTAEGQLSVHQARTLNISANITGSGGLTFVGFSVGANKGSLVLGGANTYTGTTNFYGYGGGANSQVSLTNSLALQNTTLNHIAGRAYTLNFGNGGTSGQTAYTFGGLSGNTNITLANNNTIVQAVALTVGGNGESTTYSGVFSDGSAAGGSLIKTGAGTLTLSGASTYTGATTVNAGRLLLTSTGSINSASALIVSNGAAFDVSAKTAYTLGTGGTTIHIGATTAGLFDGANVTAMTLGNALALEFDTASLGASSYNLFDYASQTGDFSGITLTGSIIGSLSNGGAGDIWTGSAGGYDFSFSEATGVLTVVPEPSAALLGGLGALALLRRRRVA